jgi:hypothetical protein
MRITETLLLKIIRETILKEIDIEEVGESCWAHGSTHELMTCTIGNDKYYLKFSDPGLFRPGEDPSLQILSEYLAYMIYRLFPDVKIPPGIELVFDRSGQRVGLATSALEQGEEYISWKTLAKLLSAGMYVDIFLAHWDISNTSNIVVSPKGDEATRIDFGGALALRAQGREKGAAFSENPGELSTMHPNSPNRVTDVYEGADLRRAADTFISVPLGSIERVIAQTRNSVSEELKSRGMTSLLKKWQKYVDYVAPILKKRHAGVLAHANRMLETE